VALHGLRERSADVEIAKNVLLEARRPTRYRYDATAFTNFVEQIVRFFATAEEIIEEDVAETDWPQKPPKRCGIPERGAYETDKSSVFIDKLHNTSGNCDEMTSFFVRRSVYFAFFGKPDHSEQAIFVEQKRLAHLARQEEARLAEQKRLIHLANQEQERLVEQ
jgi:hypothetical protein